MELGTAQQFNKSGYTRARFYVWAKLTNVIEQNNSQQI